MKHHMQKHTASEPRRILMTADPIGGVWTYVLELARGLSRHGIEISLATMGQPLSADQKAEVAHIHNIVLYESSFKLEWMENPWEEVRQSGQWLLSLEEEIKPELIHLNGYIHAALPWKAPCLVVAHSCKLSRWEAVRGTEPPQRLQQYREQVNRGLAAADLVVAPSAAMLFSLESFYPQAPQGRVIHNARSRGTLTPGKKSDYIFSVGRLWDEAKNITTLAKASCCLAWPVYVAGETTHPSGQSANIDHVHLLGLLPPSKLAHWFSMASIYVHPARYEPFGLTVLEAAMSGCALVLGDIPSLREIWQDAAVFVPPDDIWTLTRTLRILCNDRSYRDEMAERALIRSRRFTVEAMAAKYLAAYASLLQNRRNQADRKAEFTKASFTVALPEATPTA
ncbi:glycosyltransferase family 4 protein [Pelotalea chapellei]|uniref:Glycosyltransferase family 4 protein n=1 Tax=Pelotalea chapellei TaxID=44671 RepID=A0ABS5UB97_9BACT|nr:glycosyltransferase family 4 protein [Pelotalea chapellei]MBT1072959.1 glycosyltransferase family 4 protein [Pelotalea chapellei]